MTDATKTGDKDHSHRTKARHVLCVVTSARRQLLCAETQFAGGFGDQTTYLRIGWGGYVDVNLFEVKLRLTTRGDLLCFGVNLLVQQLDFCRIKIAKFKTQHHF